MIDIICHPDRSAAEWRDLLFGWVSIHAKRCDYGANFRNMTIHSSSTNTYRLKPKLTSSNPALTLEPREFESHFKPFTFSKDYKQSPPMCLGHTTYFARNSFQASIGSDGELGPKKTARRRDLAVFGAKMQRTIYHSTRPPIWITRAPPGFPCGKPLVIMPAVAALLSVRPGLLGLKMLKTLIASPRIWSFVLS